MSAAIAVMVARTAIWSGAHANDGRVVTEIVDASGMAPEDVRAMLREEKARAMRAPPKSAGTRPGHPEAAE